MAAELILESPITVFGGGTLVVEDGCYVSKIWRFYREFKTQIL